jgi:hypothetical protein
MARSSTVRIASLVLASLVLGGASSGSCIPPIIPFGKSSDAAVPAADSTGGSSTFSVVSQCSSFATYRTSADPVFQRMCMACHATGGRGAGKLLFAATTTNEDDKVATNFTASLTELLADDQGNLDSNPLLARLNGTISHDITLDIAGDDYAALRGWVGEERAAPCGSTTTTTTTSP